MRRKLARLGRNADPSQPPLLLGLQIDQARISLELRHDRARPAGAEPAQGFEADPRRRATDFAKSLGDVAREAVVHIADEAQRDMIVFRIEPARADAAAARERHLGRDARRQFQSREQARQEALLSQFDSNTIVRLNARIKASVMRNY